MIDAITTSHPLVPAGSYNIDSMVQDAQTPPQRPVVSHVAFAVSERREVAEMH
ncbi:MAG: hypothetical protein WC732_09945 [Candidatus Omnitrophota bacterium]